MEVNVVMISWCYQNTSSTVENIGLKVFVFGSCFHLGFRNHRSDGAEIPNYIAFVIKMRLS